MFPIRKIDTLKNSKGMNPVINPELKEKLQDRRLQAENPNMDIRKRQFIKKGILGIIAGIGIAAFSKIARAGGINFFGEPDGSLVDSAKGVAKGWCNIAADGTLNSPSYNVASITDTGTGQRTVVWATDFSSTVYAVVASLEDDIYVFHVTTAAAGSSVHNIRGADSPFTLTDILSCVVAFGDQ